MTRTLDGRAKTVTNQYDSLDRVKTTTYPDGEQVAGTYGTDGNLISLSGTSAYVTSVSYAALGKVAAITYGNGVTTNYDYYDSDSEHDPSSGGRAYSYRIRTVLAGGGSVLNLSYQYDAAGNVKQKVDGTNTESYTYDELDRLVTAVGSVYGSLSFGYDRIDNIGSVFYLV